MGFEAVSCPHHSWVMPRELKWCREELLVLRERCQRPSRYSESTNRVPRSLQLSTWLCFSLTLCQTKTWTGSGASSAGEEQRSARLEVATSKGWLAVRLPSKLAGFSGFVYFLILSSSVTFPA